MSTVDADTHPGGETSARSNPHLGRVRQVMLVRFKRNLPAEQVEGIEIHFRALPDRVEGLRDLEWGTNISDERLNDRFTHCFTVTFDDAAGRDAWVEHRARQAFMALLRPKADRLVVFDYAIAD